MLGLILIKILKTLQSTQVSAQNQHGKENIYELLRTGGVCFADSSPDLIIILSASSYRHSPGGKLLWKMFVGALF